MREITLLILAYLAENPEASDTLEGIADWWLVSGQEPAWRASVEQALVELVAQGWLSESRSSDNRTRYRLAPGKTDAIAAFRR